MNQPTPPPADEQELFRVNLNIFALAIKIFKFITASVVITLAVIPILQYFQLKWEFAFIGAGVILIFGALYTYFIYNKTYFSITNQRIILSIQKGFLINDSRSANLNKIKETAFKVETLGGKIFGYGTLLINTEAEFLENRFMEYPFLDSVKEVKLYIDKITALVEQGTARDQLPPFNHIAINDNQGTSTESQTGEQKTDDTFDPKQESSPKVDSEKPKKEQGRDPESK